MGHNRFFRIPPTGCKNQWLHRHFTMPPEEQGSIPTHLDTQEIGLRSGILKPSKAEGFLAATSPVFPMNAASIPHLFEQDTRLASLPPPLKNPAKSHLRDSQVAFSMEAAGVAFRGTF